jgi:hypothetical protein
MAKGQKRSNKEIKKPKQVKAAPIEPVLFAKGAGAIGAKPAKKA